VLILGQKLIVKLKTHWHEKSVSTKHMRGYLKGILTRKMEVQVRKPEHALDLKDELQTLLTIF
jgi:hypothetical protein